MSFKSGTSPLIRISGVVIALFVALTAATGCSFLQEQVEEANAPEVGTCLKITGSSANADHEELDCGDDEAVYKVLSDEGDCGSDYWLSYTITLGSGDEGNVADLCLDLNAAEGDCFYSTTTEDKKVDCAATKGDADTFLVSAVLDSATGKCPGQSQAFPNAAEDTTLCLEANA